MKVYTVEDVAEILKVSTWAVKKYIRENKLKTVKNIGSVRITEEQLNAFLRGE